MIDLKNIPEITGNDPGNPTENDQAIINDLIDVIGDLLLDTDYDIDPESYFVWMYTVGPIPEA